MSDLLTKPPQRPHHWMNADGTCHAGDLFEAGTPAMPLYTFEQMEAWVMAERTAALRAAALRAAAVYLRHQATLRFEKHGPHDSRGAALWDAGCAVDPDDGNAINSEAGS